MLEGAERAVELAGQSERRLERPRRAVPHERDPLGRRGSRSRRRVVRAGAKASTCSTSRPAAGMSRAGCARRVRTSSPSIRRPGMQADVIAPAEHLPFADGSFDAVACRVAAHHFDDVARRGEGDGARRTASRRRSATTRSSARRPRRPTACATRATCATTATASGRASSSSPGSRSRSERMLQRPLEIEPWLARVELHRRRRRARARAARPTASSTAGCSCRRSSSRE